MSEIVSVGSFCPHETCADYGKVEVGNIIRYGKSGEGRQRFQCKSCGKTFNDRSGTLFHGRKTPAKDIMEVLAMLAEGMRISSISRVKGFKEDTVLDWLREAAGHAEQIERVLLSEYQVSQAQIDGLWTYVGRKEKKRNP
jgi:transposase-like protein